MTYLKLLLSAAGLVALAAMPTAYADPPGKPKRLDDLLTVDSLLQFENARAQAEATYDARALGQEVGNDLVLGHGGGDVITKQQYLDSIRNATDHFVTSIQLANQTGVIYGDIGITNGVMTNHLKNNMDHVSRYLGVYKYDNGHWSLIRWQTTDIGRNKH